MISKIEAEICFAIVDIFQRFVIDIGKIELHSINALFLENVCITNFMSTLDDFILFSYVFCIIWFKWRELLKHNVLYIILLTVTKFT